ncbi:LacI family DNA-binding transcriptional regulator [Bifidobacterium aesculapii]|uniref:LacI family DNA-binding transcriptional regulator n=1 Tax=Bifidobacterium aesculapii TaxID=1329411 RepID=UPI0006E3D5C7|nr:LacI family DNA-binding transcriptional regulator [Bifidobacterium aesculapii]
MAKEAPHQSKPQRATRADVARLAQVSTAVVSYVMNNGPKNVAPATSQRVREAARALNYRPNSAARALRKGASELFGVIVPDFRNPYFASINDAIEVEASQHGYSTMFLASHANPDSERDCIEKLLLRDVDGIFMAPAQSYDQLASMERRDCAFILLDNRRGAPGYKCVASDFVDGVDQVVRHFALHGRTDTAMLFGGETPSVDGRIQGWYQAHQRLGIPAGPIHRSYFTNDGAYQAVNAMLDDGEQPNAIFAGSDFEAIGALRALHERGIRIPEDVSLISFDGTFMCENTWPQLTSVHQNVKEIARTAVAAALDPDAPDAQQIPVTLDIRQSCGCPVE